MAKRIIISRHGDDIPFLRGILVKSLADAGLSFDQAYDLAQTVRDKLDDDFEISYSELAELTADLLEEKHGSEMRANYENCPKSNLSENIVVHTPTRDVPFSAAIITYDLECYGIKSNIAADTGQIVFNQLISDEYQEINSADINLLIYQCLRDNYGQKIADVFVSWKAFEDSEMSLIVLIGGITGVGKSTVSHEICYKLDIPQVQSTDMIREIIRAYLAPPLVPLLQYSSFDAWKAIPEADTKKRFFKKGPPVVEGFLSQLSILTPALESSIDRALREHNHLIIEGVHVLTTEFELTAAKDKAIVVPVMLATTSKSSLKKQLTRRGKEQDKRPASRYIENIDHIWALQSYLLKTADNAEITILTNNDIKSTVNSIISLISDNVVQRFNADDYRDQWEQTGTQDAENL